MTEPTLGCPDATLRDVSEAVMSTFSIGMADLRGPHRERHVTTARQVFAYVCCEDFGATRAQVGRFLRRDHTTITITIRRVDEKAALYMPWVQMVRDRLNQENGDA